VQLGVFLLTLTLGLQFYFFTAQALGPGPVTISRPPGVEGFLPIGAVMGWKLFWQTGIWDPVHPAAMVILGFAGLASLLWRKSFCSWFCPVGALSEQLWKLGRKLLGRNLGMPRWLDIPLRGLKYAVLGYFLWVILNMSVMAIMGFLQSPYYKASDVKMLYFFTRMTGLTAWILAGLAALSLVLRNFWCRYLCPYGALMGLLALAGPSRIERDPEACLDCGRCARVCPSHLPVDAKKRILSAECTGCLDCVGVCPAPGALELRTAPMRRFAWSPLKLGLAIIGLFVILVYGAAATGHWQSRTPEGEFRAALRQIEQLDHPR
jgi:polyferredoxin